MDDLERGIKELGDGLVKEAFDGEGYGRSRVLGSGSRCKGAVEALLKS